MLSLVHPRESKDEATGVREEDLLRVQVRVNSVRLEPLRKQLESGFATGKIPAGCEEKTVC
jgi:hypothetical protein